MKKKYYIIGICLIGMLVLGGLGLMNSGTNRLSSKNNEGYTDENNKDALPTLPSDSDSNESESENDEEGGKKNETHHTSEVQSETKKDSGTEVLTSTSNEETEGSDSEDGNSSEINKPNDNDTAENDSLEMPFVPFD